MLLICSHPGLLILLDLVMEILTIFRPDSRKMDNLPKLSSLVLCSHEGKCPSDIGQVAIGIPFELDCNVSILESEHGLLPTARVVGRHRIVPFVRIVVHLTSTVGLTAVLPITGHFD
jgi:hypothetical protein